MHVWRDEEKEKKNKNKSMVSRWNVAFHFVAIKTWNYSMMNAVV